MSKFSKFVKHPIVFYKDAFKKFKSLRDNPINNLINIYKNSNIDNINFNPESIPQTIFNASIFKYKGFYYISDLEKFTFSLVFIELFTKSTSVTIHHQKYQGIQFIKFITGFSNFDKLYSELKLLKEFTIIVTDKNKLFYSFKIIITSEIDNEFINNNKSGKIAKISKKYVKEFASPFSDNEFNFDVDVVYSYVDSRDPKWEKLWKSKFGDDLYDPSRYETHDELKYSLRSINQFMPWIRTIFIVSNCEPPIWLDCTNSKIKWIYHEEILDLKYLPTFNSHAIECSLHKIRDLADNFIYFNDDVFVNKQMDKSDFFVYKNMSVNFNEPYDVCFYSKKVLKDFNAGYQHAVLNVQTILKDNYGYTPRYLMQHTPHAAIKAICNKIEEEFTDYFKVTRQNSLRSFNDINFLSFFYPHYSLIHGNSKHKTSDSIIVTPKNYKSFIRNSNGFSFFCINSWDSNNSDFCNLINNYLNTTFYIIPRWEI